MAFQQDVSGRGNFEGFGVKWTAAVEEIARVLLITDTRVGKVIAMETGGVEKCDHLGVVGHDKDDVAALLLDGIKLVIEHRLGITHLKAPVLAGGQGSAGNSFTMVVAHQVEGARLVILLHQCGIVVPGILLRCAAIEQRRTVGHVE